MIKDKVITMENGQSYYVIEEVEYNNKKYVLSLECDLDKDTVNEDDYLVMELELTEDDFVIRNIQDDETAKVVANMLLIKLQKED
jgi:hypothetical protein